MCQQYSAIVLGRVIERFHASLGWKALLSLTEENPTDESSEPLEDEDESDKPSDDIFEYSPTKANEVSQVSEADMWELIKEDTGDFTIETLRHLAETTTLSLHKGHLLGIIQVEEQQNISTG
jgi:hypothetical protein